MDDKLFKILGKVYHGGGEIFDLTTETNQYSLERLNQDELTYLNQSGYPVNEIINYSHNDCIKEYKKIINSGKISINKVLSAYICAFSSFPRGGQPILSYLFGQAVPDHDIIPYSETVTTCKICSINKKQWVEKGYNIYRSYCGQVWGEHWCDYIIDLQEFVTLPDCIPTGNDLQIFQAIIDSIRRAVPEETPSKLELRIKKEKIMPHYEKYTFRGLLLVLAELGVMPNPYIKPLYDGFTDFDESCKISRTIKGSSRSDIILPLSGWRGINPINEERLHLLFGSFGIK